MSYVVYRHINLINDKSYIGFTSFSLEKRWNDHCYFAFNGSKYAFHRAIRKYGKQCWAGEILKICHTKNEAKAFEIESIIKYKTYTGIKNCLGYNMTLGGEGSNGYIMSLEQRKLLRGTNSARAKLSVNDVISIKQKYILGVSQYDLATEFNIKQSNVSRILSHKTYVDVMLSGEEELKIETMLHDKIHNKIKFVKDSTRKKVSINRRGSKNGMYGKTGIDNPNFGKKRTEASKQLMREKALLRKKKDSQSTECNI